MFRSFIGVDPGKYGAIAIYEPPLIQVHDMPLLPSGRICGRSVSNFLFLQPRPYALVEDVHSMPSDGVASAFSFGQAHGTVLGVLEALGIGYVLVRPAVWKTQLGLSSDKNASRDLAIARFPNFVHYFQRKKDHGRAEASLLALLAYQRFGGPL